MDSYYIFVKLAHIMSAIVVMGTGAGIAFFMLMAVISKNSDVIKNVTKSVVIADWVFTFPFALVQFFSGGWLMNYIGYSFNSPWFETVGTFYLILMFSWFVVVWIQYRLKKISHQPDFDISNNDAFKGLFKWWLALGVIGYSCILVVFYYMVVKPVRFF